MDIQKEREAFEEHITDAGLVEFAGYGFDVDECDEYLHEPTQVAWDSWLIGLRRSKAQAIPEGFVLVPTECTDEIAEAIAFSARVCGGVANDVYESIVKAVIEAQEEN